VKCEYPVRLFIDYFKLLKQEPPKPQVQAPFADAFMAVIGFHPCN